MIIISTLEGSPDSLIAELKAYAEKERVELYTEERKTQEMAGIEDFIPAAVMLFLAKPFFDSYLSQAGEDAYALTKKTITNLISRCRSIRIKILSAGGKKISGEQENSKEISIHIKRLDGFSVKFLIPRELNEEDTEILVDSLLSEIRSYYLNTSESELKKEFDRVPSGQTLMYYSKEDRNWSTRTLQEMVEKQRNKS